jgi:sulfate transporter 4
LLHSPFSGSGLHLLQITFVVGVMWFAVGIARLDFLANFLSHSVISGFTTGAALTIGFSQLKYVFGLGTKSKDTAIKTIIAVVKDLGETKWREFVMCIIWLAVLLSMKNVGKRFKKLAFLRAMGPITVCIVAVIVTVIGDLDGKGHVKTVKDIPQGTPSHCWPSLSTE